MTTAYTSLLGLALPVTGELSGTWGDTVNNSITSLLDTSVAGTTNVSTDTDVTLTTTTGASNTARQAILLFSGARTALRTVTAPAQSKVYTVINATTGGYSVKLVGAGPTTGVTIVAGESAVCAWNGSDFVKVSNTGGSASFTTLTSSSDATLNGLTVGRGAGAVATNTAVGASALAANTSGANNTAVGQNSLTANTSGSLNAAFGVGALQFATTADTNTALGTGAQLFTTTGAGNTSVGRIALFYNTTGASNVAVGKEALFSNTTASNNTAVGYQAGYSNTTGKLDAFGAGTLYTNTTGISNAAFGATSLNANTTGSYNTAMGAGSSGIYGALQLNTTGSSNTAFGAQSLASNTTASNNTAVGYQAGYSNTTGANNTFLGYTAGTAVTTGSNLTVIGYTAAASAVGATNEITLGNSSIATLRCQVTTITALSDSRDKENIQELQAGLDFVSKLKPVSFDWNMRDGGKVGIADTGFIAQDLRQVQIDTGITIPDLVYEENPERLEAGYGKLLPVLVKAIQEQQAIIESLKARLDAANL